MLAGLALAIGLVLLAVAVVQVVSGDDGDGAAPSTSVVTATTAAEPGPAVAAGTTAPTTPEHGLGEGVAPSRDGRAPLRGFGEVAVTVTSADGTECEVCLLAATDTDQRARGLMEVTDPDLGGYDGMLFVYPEEIDGAFWMRNTPQPLSIAYFDAAGDLVSTADMAPCADDPGCRSYPADAPFRFAVEVVQGRLPDVGIDAGASLRIDGYRCPAAAGT